ncbi:hypothetical protein PF003_g4458 [Phytophthora fragariae]|nr:hypothetical protein PF003_g4458 [Phytophthora fragariae]
MRTITDVNKTRIGYELAVSCPPQAEPEPSWSLWSYNIQLGFQAPAHTVEML